MRQTQIDGETFVHCGDVADSLRRYANLIGGYKDVTAVEKQAVAAAAEVFAETLDELVAILDGDGETL